MGNMVGIISYDPVDHDRFRKLVDDIRIKHRLQISKQQECHLGKEYTCVDICGLFLEFYGHTAARRDIQAFLYDCEKQLGRAGATNIESNITFLPM